MAYNRDLMIWILGVTLGALLTSQLLAGCSYTSTTSRTVSRSIFAPPLTEYSTSTRQSKPVSLGASSALRVSRTFSDEQTFGAKNDEQSPEIKSHRNEPPLKRKLLLPEGHFGLSNQMACLNLAAILAKQYDRTLVVPANGVASNGVHDLFPIPFERVYDTTKARIPFEIDDYGSQVGNKHEKRRLPPKCAEHTIEFDTKHIYNPSLGVDHYTDEECITLICSWTRLRFVAPPDIFPHVDQVFFPYNPIYHKAATDVIRTIKKEVSAKIKNDATVRKSDVPASKDSSPRLLTLHVRRGDRSTVPLFDCVTSLADVYPNVSVDKAERLPVVCSAADYTDRAQPNFWDHALTWDKFFEHLADPNCQSTSFPVCAQDFDAIFVATNDPTWVRKTAKELNLPPLFLLGDFPLLKDILLPDTLKSGKPEESAEMLLIEEMILVLSDHFVPSFESSITQQVLRLRIDEHQHPWDKLLLDTYYDFRAQAHRIRWPNGYEFQR